jgi:hypothetical protein
MSYQSDRNNYCRDNLKLIFVQNNHRPYCICLQDQQANGVWDAICCVFWESYKQKLHSQGDTEIQIFKHVQSGYGLDLSVCGVPAGWTIGPDRSSSPSSVHSFHFSTSSRPALGDHAHSYPVGTGISLLGGKAVGRGIIHLQLVSRSRECEAIYSLLHTLSWCRAWLVKQKNKFAFGLQVTTVRFMCLQSQSINIAWPRLHHNTDIC